MKQKLMEVLKQKGKLGSSNPGKKKMTPDMKSFLLIREHIKYLITILCCFSIINKTTAQSDNIYLDGDNYITLNNPAFPSRLDWKDASKERITMTADQPSLKTYWFSHNGKSYIIINAKLLQILNITP
ncbi:MAG: hypothetical protein ACRDE2_17175 [Chitinophagaceae bacterium]